MFSTLFKKQDREQSLCSKRPDKKSFYSDILLLFKNIFCENEQQKRNEEEHRTEIYSFRCVATSLCKEITTANKKNAQGLSDVFCKLLASINIAALNGLMINKSLFRSLAEMNSIFCLSGIDQEYYHPDFEAHTSSPYVFNSFTSLPEYIFAGDYLKLFAESSDSGHFQKTIIFQRVFLEIFMGSSIIVQKYKETGTINNPLFERILENGKELEFLLNRSLLDRDLLNFEMEREKSLADLSCEGAEKLMAPYIPPLEDTSDSENVSEDLSGIALQQAKVPVNSKMNNESAEKRSDVEVIELPNVELLGESEESIEDANAGVILFLSKLEEDHHRRDIYLAIISYDFVNEGNILTFDSLWKWLVEHLAESPLQTRNIDGYEVKVCLRGGVVEHLGLLEDPERSSQIKEDTFRRVYYKDIKDIVPKIQEFCAKRNIGNIPIIP
ncbi:hypothetical protein [Maridesulfovibrio sp.]|uniref:hypothetical protein n=1 Tax=unclassified Maridesulfovibrio TaxID=2794999 RepID=UPI003AFF7F92